MGTGYELLLPSGVLDYFTVIEVEQSPRSIIIDLEERDLSQDERQGHRLYSKGFYPSADIHDFPVRGKSLILRVRRRRWQDMDTGDPFMRDWDLVAQGTRLTAEFAAFLKALP
ncbi:MAG: hypothetical protein LBV71_14040 [Prevotella sp.]|jgi:hypothetical protein|nr:hypothetical protein [Prevotella sp.]